MKIRVFSTGFLVISLVSSTIKAQTIPSSPTPPVVHKKEAYRLGADEARHLARSAEKIAKDLELMSLKLSKEISEEFKSFKNLDFENSFDNGMESADPEYNAVEKVKNISKLYSVDRGDKLAINNQYGKVAINVWPRNEIKVDIEIKAYQGSEAEAQRLIDDVSIEENKAGKVISFKTIIDRESISNRISRITQGHTERKGVWIDYTIHMPAGNPLEIANRFGNVSIPDFEGPLNVRNSYGSLTAANLQNASTSIDVKYGSASIQKITTGKVAVSYGSLKISNAVQVNTDVKYGSTQIQKISSGGKIVNAYGTLRINELDEDVKSLIINSDKGSVTMGVKPSSNFDFNVTVNMGGFNYPGGSVNLTSSPPDSQGLRPQFTKTYSGEFGKGSQSRIQINCSYGSVKFQ